MVSKAGLKAIAATAILSGPTASGKTEVALDFVRGKKRQGLHIEIINADSLLIYRMMDIGTAKPSQTELAEIPHHLISICDPDETFTAGDFSKQVLQALDGLEKEGKRALVVGGSGFYLKALLYGLWQASPADPKIRSELDQIPSPELYQTLYALDPESALRIGVNDRYRLIRAHELLQSSGKTPSELQAEQNRTPDPRLRLLVIDRPNETLHERIRKRTLEMLRLGLIEEVKSLRGLYPHSRALMSVGYDQVVHYLDAVTPEGRKIRAGEEGLIDEIELATRQLVKRQRTWFKSEKNAERFELERDRKALNQRLEEIYS